MKKESKMIKRILITGKNSYVGTNVEKWLLNKNSEYFVETLDMKDTRWTEFDFSGFDVVFHVAGIAHVSTKKRMRELYYKVNRDLAIEVAKKAKIENVKQFILMSSGIVYGDCSKIGINHSININTPPCPSNDYGKSKLQAEQGILEMESSLFKVCVLRAPMIYGPGCKGNYNSLSKFGKKLKVFPNIINERSVLFIDNLSEFVNLMIENVESGIFFPQNNEFICTSKIVLDISSFYGNNLRLTKFFNPIIKLISLVFPKLNKAFGSFIYDKDMSVYNTNYQIVNYLDSIIITETKSQ